ncbi:PAS domain-containing protein [Streptomyces sp. CC210A]|uniref:PAS domain-containing protein n=1 Tax=Streptomyces sp. CC210A TaxID=2898184 RepID=UPI0035A8D2CC
MSSRPSRGAARLAAILDALPDGLVLVNTNGTVVNANTIALEMFETPGTALVGRGLLDLLPAFDSRLIPGSMRRPDSRDPHGRTKPTRMVARRTDGGEFPVEVTSASLEDGREAYDSYGSGVGYSGDELLMLVVRDLSGTLDTEAELARSQRQTEMILRAASEGVVGTDTDGRIVLVNPAAAQILGWRASDLGGKELHALMLHSKADGEPFPYDESPLADTLRSGRKHRVRGQVVWAKDGSPVPVDLTTAPVRDGDQLVGAVMTFADRRPYEQLAERHAAELAALEEKHAAEAAAAAEEHAGEVAAYEERLAEAARRYDALGVRHAQLTAVLDPSLRGPLEELRRELGVLAADPAGQLWPEANQILHHLAAGYARMTTLVDNVLCFQRLDSGEDELRKDAVQLDGVVAAGVDGAVELIGPGRVQFAVHAPPVAAEVDGARLAAALAHLIADVAGVDSTGTSRVAGGGGYVDSTVVVAAAQRGDVVRIEVRGPHGGGDPVHQPIVRGIVRAHGGVLQTHEVPGPGGSAFVLEVPVGSVENGAAGAAAPAAPGKSADSADSPAVAAPGGTVGAPGLAGSDGAAGAGEATGSGAATGSGGAGEAVVGAPSPGPAGDVSGAVPVSAAPQAHVVPGVPAAGTPAAGVPGPGAPAGAVSPAGTPTAGSEAPESPAPGTPGSHAPEPAGAPEAAGAPRPAGASEPSGAPGAAGATEVPVAAALPAQQSGDTAGGGGRRRARRASTDAFLDSPVRAEDPVAAEPTGRRRARRAAEEGTDGAGGQRVPAQAPAQDQPAEAALPAPTGRRRGRPSPGEPVGSGPALAPQAAPAQAPLAPAARTGVPAEGAVVMAGETAQTRPAGLGGTVPPQGVPQGEAPVPVPPQGTGKRARRASAPEGAVAALPPAPAPPLRPRPRALPYRPGGVTRPVPYRPKAPIPPHTPSRSLPPPRCRPRSRPVSRAGGGRGGRSPGSRTVRSPPPARPPRAGRPALLSRCRPPKRTAPPRGRPRPRTGSRRRATAATTPCAPLRVRTTHRRNRTRCPRPPSRRRATPRHRP